MRDAMLVAIIGAALVTWAYVAPRVMATYRQVREQRLAVISRPNRMERVAPGDPAIDREFGRIVRRLSVTDGAWVEAMRRVSRVTRTASRWASRQRNMNSGWRYGGPVR